MEEFNKIIYATDASFSKGEMNNLIKGYKGNSYIETLINEGDFIDFRFDIPHSGFYKIEISYALPGEQSLHRIAINNQCYGSLKFDAADSFTIKEISSLKLEEGMNSVKLVKQYGYVNLDYIAIQEDTTYFVSRPEFTLSNQNATEECKGLMKFFSNIYGKGILSGQHCNKASGSDLEYIKRITGKLPSILGFDLLSYSSATDTEDSDFQCIDEIINNRGSVETAINWAKNTDAIITLCWHWFSPMNGRNKSFYTKNTDFDLNRALITGTDENIAMIKDLDLIAEQLKRFRDNNIPILWRPLHEACGGWFWWGAHGKDAYIKLYRLMYDRYVHLHELNNLIWVWNSPDKDWYPGDDVVDINSIDYYAPLEDHGPLTVEFINTSSMANAGKPLALGENGPIPNPEILKATETNWLWFMIWNNVINEVQWNTKEEHIEFFSHPYMINLEDIKKYK
ncbi:glycosyl hydrolase [Clostridium manihotivorum]|uniref:Beta-mannosidase n=1 Tax=Clostridium manihotivorum TaxID=2320868 RepID=A0A410DZG6_9CLOT|nr:glycosyl hydrolase [Clostridium manihotivorum]QAA34445.1 beta-mannosidase [Clostridium manihotivorum]